jgi:hypothetical protein
LVECTGYGNPEAFGPSNEVGIVEALHVQNQFQTVLEPVLGPFGDLVSVFLIFSLILDGPAGQVRMVASGKHFMPSLTFLA